MADEPMHATGLSRWERRARWNSIVFLPISGVGLLLIGGARHGPIELMYLGLVLVWPWVLMMGPPFGVGGLRLLGSVVGQWVWCLEDVGHQPRQL